MKAVNEKNLSNLNCFDTLEIHEYSIHTVYTKKAL